VTNSISGPCRAVILTGKYSHKNGFLANENQKPFDGSQQTFPKLLQKAGYQTAMIGKWHLGSDPTGFDHWEILPGQGVYYNPEFINNSGHHTEKGYVTELITEKCLRWLEKAKDSEKPFML
jgi:arylsulfatase A-like enzyme